MIVLLYYYETNAFLKGLSSYYEFILGLCNN